MRASPSFLIYFHVKALITTLNKCKNMLKSHNKDLDFRWFNEQETPADDRKFPALNGYV